MTEHTEHLPIEPVRTQPESESERLDRQSLSAMLSSFSVLKGLASQDVDTITPESAGVMVKKYDLFQNALLRKRIYPLAMVLQQKALLEDNPSAMKDTAALLHECIISPVELEDEDPHREKYESQEGFFTTLAFSLQLRLENRA